jgi:hypothetical protein
MNPNDFENPNNEIDNENAETVYVQNICLDHLKSHKIKSHPEKAEFLMLFGGLLESKIKFKIKKEISLGIPDYWDEFPTLITRSKPFKKFDDWFYDNPFEYEETRKYLQNSTPSLAQFIVERFTYNNPFTIFLMISDFALVEDYKEFNQIKRQFDLQNPRIEKFIDQRNDAVHDIVNVKICDADVDYVQSYLEKIYEDILDMISRALKIRAITNDNLKSSEKDYVIKFQSEWFKKILYDLDHCYEDYKLPKKTKYYHLFNEKEIARKELKECVKAKMIQKKMGNI